jgi:multidrug efflux pump subunit AcrB
MSPEQSMQTEKMRSRNQFRTITVKAIPIQGRGRLASEVINAARQKLQEFAKELPPGYRLEIGGEEEDTIKGFRNLAIVLLISVVCIFLALVFQFKKVTR